MSTQSKPLPPARPPISPRELADITGMSVDFVYLEIEAGELRASRFGRFYRIAVDEAVRYLEVKQFPVPGGWAHLK